MDYVPLSKVEIGKARTQEREEPSNGNCDDFNMVDIALTNIEAEQPLKTSDQKRRKISRE